ncbi:hypothetical protein WJ968_26035 [Achromobacter xylosoxidans]
MMNTKGILSRLSRTAACIALAAGAQQALAQDIKIGFNGDLSASPSAQSGQAAVLGLKTAIEDINAAGGLLGARWCWWCATTCRSRQSRSRT